MEFIMKTKTKSCGECKYFVGNGEDCIYYCNIESMDEPCECFEKPTNGDKIRQMSDEELAERLVYEATTCDGDGHVLSGYKSILTGGFWIDRPEAIAGTMKELRKEWKNGK